MIAEPRRLALIEAGKLKLAAKARLAEGGEAAQKARHREKLLRQALDAAMVGGHAASLTPDDRKLFRAMELGLREMLAGRKPTTEILYRCGLGILATATQQADPMDIVLSRRFDAAA